MYLNPREHEIHKGFYYCWFANETIVNKYGDAISLRTGKKLPKWLDNNTELMRGVIHHNGEKIYSNIGVLVAKTFLTIPEKIRNKRVFVNHKNNDKLNDFIDNLEWVNNQEKQISAFLKRRNYNKQKYCLPSYIENTDFYDEKPIECVFKLGYFYIPFTKTPIVINKQGHLFNLETNKDHPVRLDHRGYYVTHLGSDINQVTWFIHRIVALIFIKKPIRHVNIPFQELSVNHKDGNKINNDWNNLEWTTNQENMDHAWENNLIKNNKIVLARNIITNVVKEYFSISDCAQEFGIEMTTFSFHLKSNSAGRIIKNNHVFKFKESNFEWPMELAVSTDYYKFKPQCNIVFINKLTTECLIFCTILEACDYLKIPVSSVKCNSHRGIRGNKPTKYWFYVSLNDYLHNGKEMYCDLI